MMVSPSMPASGATLCQISSVMKGMMGWARRSRVSSTWTRVWRVPRLAASELASLVSTGLDSSRYQSQYSFQVNS